MWLLLVPIAVVSVCKKIFLLDNMKKYEYHSTTHHFTLSQPVGQSVVEGINNEMIHTCTPLNILLDAFEVFLSVFISLTTLKQTSLALQREGSYRVDIHLGIVLSQIPHHALALVHNGLKASVTLFVLLMGSKVHRKRGNTLRQYSNYREYACMHIYLRTHIYLKIQQGLRLTYFELEESQCRSCGS